MDNLNLLVQTLRIFFSSFQTEFILTSRVLNATKRTKINSVGAAHPIAFKTQLKISGLHFFPLASALQSNICSYVIGITWLLLMSQKIFRKLPCSPWKIKAIRVCSVLITSVNVAMKVKVHVLCCLEDGLPNITSLWHCPGLLMSDCNQVTVVQKVRPFLRCSFGPDVDVWDPSSFRCTKGSDRWVLSFQIIFVNPGKLYCLWHEALNKTGSMKMMGDDVLGFSLISVMNMF